MKEWRKKTVEFLAPRGFRDSLGEVYQGLKRARFFQIAGLLILVLLLASSAMYLAEHRTGENTGFWDSIWWSLVTITTVGYGDVVPLTIIGRVVGVSLMLSGLVLVSLMTATIASVFVTRKIKEGKGLEDVRDKDHIVICGWNESGLDVIRGLEKHLAPNMPVVVLINNLPREEVDSIIYHFPEMECRFVRGNFTREEILSRANLVRARSAVILADTAGGYPSEKADERTIFGCMTIKSMAPMVKTCAELISRENREYLTRANVDEVFIRGEPSAAFLASAAATTGLSSVMRGLLDLNRTNKLWRVPIPERFIGQTVAELSEYYREKFEAILIAVVTETNPIRLGDILSHDATAIDEFIARKFEQSGRDYFSAREQVSVQINPPRDYVLTKDDAAIVLGEERPVETSFLGKSLDRVTGGKKGDDK